MTEDGSFPVEESIAMGVEDVGCATYADSYHDEQRW